MEKNWTRNIALSCCDCPIYLPLINIEISSELNDVNCCSGLTVRRIPGYLPPKPFTYRVQLLRILIAIVNSADEVIQRICYRLVTREFGKHCQIFIVFESFSDEFETDALNGNVCRPAYNVGPAGIKQSAVAVAAEKINIFPRVLRLHVRFCCTVVEFAPYIVFPC